MYLKRVTLLFYPCFLAKSRSMGIYVNANNFLTLHLNSFFHNRHYLKLFRQTNPTRLAQALENCNGNSGDNLNHAKESNPEIIGDVYIHPSANIHPSAVVRTSIVFCCYIFLNLLY